MIFISSLSPINLILIISTFLNFLFKKLHHQRYSFLSIYNTFSTDTFALTAFFQNYIYIHICSRAPLSSYFWYTLIAITNPLVEYRLPNVSLHHQRLEIPHKCSFSVWWIYSIIWSVIYPRQCIHHRISHCNFPQFLFRYIPVLYYLFLTETRIIIILICI